FPVFLSFLFFFSSRRRHTRWPRDWSSDVCSSDLEFRVTFPGSFRFFRCSSVWVNPLFGMIIDTEIHNMSFRVRPFLDFSKRRARSEERRVGKECRYQVSLKQ